MRPVIALLLAPSVKPLIEQPYSLESEYVHISDIAGNCIVLVVPPQRSAELVHQKINWEMPILFQPDVEFLELACDLFPRAFHFHQELSLGTFAAIKCEPEEIKRFRLAFAPSCPVFLCKSAKLHYPCFLFR